MEKQLDCRRWQKDTAYLRQLKVTHRARARAAARWRPIFLEALTKSCTCTDALKAANVAYNTLRQHQRNDPEFAKQVDEAEEEGAHLLLNVCWKDVTGGYLEPVYWQGEKVGEIRRYDTKLRIEMLRAYLPNLFKTPGATTTLTINRGNGEDAPSIYTPNAAAEIQQRRQAALRRTAEAEAGAR